MRQFEISAPAQGIALPKDRSAPRARRSAGDRSIDGRGRVSSAPAVLSDGFRPFFLGAATVAAAAVPLWLWMHLTGVASLGPFTGPAWHAHEMIFGYLAAVMAGFILTAVPNWTGRLPLSGWPLGALFLLWLAGRIACATIGNPWAALLLDCLFLAALSGAVWREVIAGRNWRNSPVAILLTLFAIANLLYHLEAVRPELEGAAIRLALGVTALLIALIGGRVTPSFTRNWLARRGGQRLPAPFGAFDKAALLAVAAAAVAWNIAPEHLASGVLLALAGILLAVRLGRWQGWRTWREPIVLVLHLGYLWLAVALLLLGCSILHPAVVPQSAALHALTAGAIGTMTLAVMTRASLGHTGRTVATNRTTLAIYVAVSAGAMLRLAAPLVPDLYLALLVAGGALWSTAFALFVLHFAPLLIQPRRSAGQK